LESLNQEVSDNLEKYEIDKATKPFFDFVEDFST
jgi:isoleucyl-tRNA synthetase